MSDEDTETAPFEFSALDLMPQWAQETEGENKKSSSRKWKDHKGESGGRKGGGFQRSKNQGGRGFQQRGRGPGGGGGGRDRRDTHRGRGPRRGNDKGRDRGRGGNRDRREQREELSVPAGVSVSFKPAPQMIAALDKHIRETNRTYPLIDLAKMVLAQRERYQVVFNCEEGKKPTQLFQCKSDQSLWLSKEEAISHFLRGENLDRYYQVEEVEVGEPKGNFSVVAVCQMSGEILGPPNHHEYQSKIARLHSERFSHMPLERYKSRIEMSSEEEVIDRWKQQVSRTLHYRIKSAEDEKEESKEEAAPTESAAGEEGQETAVESPEADGETVSTEEDISAVDPELKEESSPGEVENAETESPPDIEEESPEGAVEEKVDEVSEEKESEESSAPPENEGPSSSQNDEPVFRSAQELAQHFRETFSKDEILECSTATVSGNVPGKLLAPGLLNLLKKESNQLRRGFPLPMIQALCKAFEDKKLRFFKRGKKALHVSSVRPKALDDSVSLTERIQKIVTIISSEQRCDVAGLLEKLVPGFEKPKSKEDASEMELSDEVKAVLTDLRWLTSEGFVLEFPDTRLVMGKQPAAKKAKSPKKKVSTPAVAEEKKPPASETISDAQSAEENSAEEE